MDGKELEKAQRISATDPEMRIWRKVDALRAALVDVLQDHGHASKCISEERRHECCSLANLDPETLEKLG